MPDIGGDIVAKYDQLRGPGVWDLIFSPGPRPEGFQHEFDTATSGRAYLKERGWIPASTGAGAPIGPQHESLSQLHYSGHGQNVVLVRRL